MSYRSAACALDMLKASAAIACHLGPISGVQGAQCRLCVTPNSSPLILEVTAMTLDSESKEIKASLVDVKNVASQLSCSARHVRRLYDSGRMPRPVKLGALVRWSSISINQWIEEGCPATSKRRSK
jgi:predicted DNA-binding transcriptional regulator AlpA